MSFKLKDVVPWGRSFNEYRAMFALSDVDLNCRILGCSDGPAAFNAEMYKLGKTCVSVDPLYQFSKKEIQERISSSYNEVMAQAAANKDEFIWDTIKDVQELGRIRKQAMVTFLNDFEKGKEQGRYITGSLPELPVGSLLSVKKEFDLALCSHFLFLYSKQFSLDFHFDAIRALCSVAREVRIFPILELGSKVSRHYDSMEEILTREGYTISLEEVAYQFQRGGNQMLRVSRHN